MGYTMMNEKLMKRLGNTYEVGDMVWGKVRSHPWWPGQIFHEAFALPCVSETKREGHVLVAFFGDNSYGWFDPMELIPFDLNYVEKSMQTDARPFVDAVEEAEDEARRRAALGLSCQCQNPCNFQATSVKGFVQVDVYGQPGGVYSIQQIKNAREAFQPVEMLSFVHEVASMPYGDLKNSINWIKNVASVLAYRKAVFVEVDETYVRVLRGQVVHGANLFGPLNLVKQVFSQDQFGKEVATVKKKSTLEIDSIKAVVDRETKRAKNFDRSQGFKCKPRFKKLVEIGHCLENKMVFGTALPPPDAVVHRETIVTSSEGMNEKPRALKWLGEDLHSEGTHIVSRKNTNKEFKSESGLEYSNNHLKNAKRESGYKPHISSSDFMATEKLVGVRRINSKLPNLLSYLLDLALKPLRSEDNIPATALQFFLKFRSVVCKKDLIVAPPAEAELIGSSSTKSSACFLAAKGSYNVPAQDLPFALKPPKKRLKPEDYAKVGINSSTSDHRQKMSVEEQNKQNELKLLTAEKNAGSWKLMKSKGKSEREMNGAVPGKLTKHTPRKLDTSTRITEPTIVMLQFSHQSALPSISELKARFARFGQLHSAPRVFWKSSMCEVIFKCRSNAKAAYDYAVKNRSLFGSAKVEYRLQALEVPAQEFPRPGKQIIGQTSDGFSTVKPMSTCYSTEPRSMAAQYPIQSKSCLKKQQRDEFIIINSKTQHVKQMMEGEDGIGRKQLMVNHNFKNFDVNHSNGRSSASASVNINAKNLHMVTSCVNDNHKLDNFVKACNLQYLQWETRESHVHTTVSQRSEDISNQMLNLLMRCQDIVAHLECFIGYMPSNL